MFERYEFKERVNSQNFNITDYEDNKNDVAGVEDFIEWTIYESKGVVHNYHDQSLGELTITQGIICSDTTSNVISLKIKLDKKVIFDVICYKDLRIEELNFCIRILKPQYIELFGKVLNEVSDWDSNFENYYKLTDEVSRNIYHIRNIYIDKKSSVEIEKLIEKLYNGEL